MISVNGVDREYLRCTVEEMLKNEGYNMKRIAVEINKNIIAKANYKDVVVEDEDVIEVISFVGGG